MVRMRFAVVLFALFGMGLTTGSAARAENPDWPNIAKSFADQFKVKSDVTLKQKRSAVNALAKCKDARGVDLLLGSVDDQQRFAAKLRKEWEQGEKEWTEKTKKLDDRVNEKFRQAKERGEDRITVDAEEAEWLGSDKGPGRMVEVKKQLGQRFAAVLEEEGLSDGMLRAISRILNTLEGDELGKASAKATSMATASKGDRRTAFTKALGYAKGDVITTYLEAQTKDTNVEIVQTALEAIGRQNTVRGAEILIAKLDDARWQARASAITGLSLTRNAKVVCKVVDAMLERAKKEEGVLQRNFFVAMARIVQEPVPGTIEAWESWWKANREEFQKKIEAREDNGLPIEDDPNDILVQTEQGSSSFYGITTSSKHIIYVIDISGSMSADAKDPGKEKDEENPDAKKRIDIAREELKKALAQLSAHESDERGVSTFNIVIFANETEVYKPGKMVDATKQAKEAAWKWVDEKIVPTYQTNIFDAVEQAFNIISATSDAKNLKKGADTIFLMTDGYPNRGKFFEEDLIIKEVKKMNATRKITLHTIGVGEGHSSKFLSELAAANGGQYIGR
jgi:hypothetical protein